jgi:hypothetical protein
MLINKQELLLEGLAFLSQLPRLLDFALPIDQKRSVAPRPDQMVDYLSGQLACIRLQPVSPFQDILGDGLDAFVNYCFDSVLLYEYNLPPFAQPSKPFVKPPMIRWYCLDL